MKKILVLGGGGFIGGHLSKKLKDEGYIEVAALAYMRGWNVDNTILVFEEPLDKENINADPMSGRLIR